MKRFGWLGDRPWRLALAMALGLYLACATLCLVTGFSYAVIPITLAVSLLAFGAVPISHKVQDSKRQEALARRYADARALPRNQQQVPALVIPIWGLKGNTPRVDSRKVLGRDRLSLF